MTIKERLHLFEFARRVPRLCRDERVFAVLHIETIGVRQRFVCRVRQLKQQPMKIRWRSITSCRKTDLNDMRFHHQIVNVVVLGAELRVSDSHVLGVAGESPLRALNAHADAVTIGQGGCEGVNRIP
jgi:hypothetical protein